jgi:hypothetical protein
MDTVVPLLIGTSDGEFRLELRNPGISFEGTEFSIKIMKPNKLLQLTPKFGATDLSRLKI